MQVYELPHVNSNFGDALNSWLWPELLPGVFDGDARVRFVGIGTLLDRGLPQAPLTVVFGTGTGYAPPPPDLRSDRWRVYGVRGPLTARVLNLAPDKALGDPAILLASLPNLRPQERKGVIFVPHWKSVRYGQWAQACALAGIEFVDPCGDARDVIRRIAGARKVIAESMHAGIVADAFRVPWTPVLLSREVAAFKWADWAATLDVPYRPLRLPFSSPVERWRDAVLRHSAFGCIDRLTPPGTVQRWSDEELLQDHAATIARVANPLRWKASIGAEIVLKRAARAAPFTHAKLSPGAYARDRDTAAAHLDAAAHTDGWLSSDAAHATALARCHDALHRLQADHRHGLLRAQQMH